MYLFLKGRYGMCMCMCVCVYEEGKGREKDKTSPKIKDGRVLMSTLRFAQLLWQRAGSLLQATSLHIWWNTHTHTLECKEQPQASVICIGFPGHHNTEQLSKHGTLYGGQKRHLSVRQRVCQTGTVTQRVAAKAFNWIIQDCRAETTPDGWGWWEKNPITMQQILLHQDLTDKTQPSYKQEVQLLGLSTSHDLFLSSVISYFTVLFETVAAKRSDGGQGSPVMVLTKVIHHISTTIYLMHPQDTDHYTHRRTHTQMDRRE